MILIAALALVACGDDGGGTTIDGPPGSADGPPAADAPPVTFTASGTVIGPNAASGPVIAAFIVTTADDYAYKFGEGTSSGTTFMVGLRGDPPTMARNIATNVDVGIALLMLMPPGTVTPDGVIQGDPPFVGISARHAIIYRGPDDTGAVAPWTMDFPVGLSCGRCVDATSGFDTFEPVECTTLVIDTDLATINACNFT